MKNIYSLCFLIAILVGCTYRKKEILVEEECPVEITYQNNAKTIIDLHCAISGCHVTGFFIGDYTMYSGVKEKVDNGQFRLKVFDLKIMPPDTQPDLNESEIATLKCWLDQGATEN